LRMDNNTFVSLAALSITQGII